MSFLFRRTSRRSPLVRRRLSRWLAKNGRKAMKRCSKCGEDKDEGEFYLNAKTNKRRGTCRQCHARTGKEWRAKNRERVRELAAARREKENAARRAAYIKRAGFCRTCGVHLGGIKRFCSKCARVRWRFARLLTTTWRRPFTPEEAMFGRVKSSVAWYLRSLGLPDIPEVVEVMAARQMISKQIKEMTK